MEITIKGQVLKVENNSFENAKGETVDYRTATILTDDIEILECSVASDLLIDELNPKQSYTLKFKMNTVFGKDNHYKLQLVDVK